MSSVVIDKARVQQEIIQKLTPSLAGISFQTPYLFLIAGFQGSGKSTVAHHLKEEYQVTLLSTDAIRQELVNRGIHGEPFAELVSTISKILLIDCLEKKRNTVFDANAHQKRLKEVTALPETAKHRLIKIYLETSAEVLIERVKSRTEKNVTKAYQGSLQDLEASFKTATMNPADYDLVVNTNHRSIQEMCSEVDAFLSQFFIALATASAQTLPVKG